MQLVGGKRTEAQWLYALAGALMVGGPVWRELYVNRYPDRPEAFIVPLVAAAIGATGGITSRLVGGLLGTMLFGGLLFVFVDLQFDLHHRTYTALLLAGSIGLALLLVTHRAVISGLALGTFYLTSLIRTAVAAPTRPATTDAVRTITPVLVHIILDEQWGVGGFRAAGDTVTAEFLKAFYLKRGFELFEAAYSRYELTTESVPIALSLGNSPIFSQEKTTTFARPYEKTLHTNPYFARLHELGYDIRVYQPTFIDYCSGTDAAVASCDVQSGNSISNIGFLEGSWITRGIWISRFFLNTRSHVYERLIHEPTIWRRSVAGGGLATMRSVTDAIREREQRPTAYFVHALLPHRPIQTDAECRVLTDPSGHIGYDYPQHPSDSLWRAALRFYAGQVRCAHKALANLIDAIDSTVGPDQSIVIVHGDHGSRMYPRKPVREALEAYTVEELNATFATLLAVRRPKVGAVLHGSPTPVQDVIWELARTDFAGPIPDKWEHTLRKMPDSSNATGTVRPLANSDMLWARPPD